MNHNTPPHRTRVKFCGITRIEDALHAASIGVDAIGLVFYAKSPRHVSIDRARAIAEVLPAFVTCVGLFVNADYSEIREILNQVKIDLLQFHGDETAAECEQYDRPYIKAVRMCEGLDFVQITEAYRNASGLLLDTWEQNSFGGTGKSFDWSMVPNQSPLPIILAGGLNPDNIEQAIRITQPYAVDVSGGIESAKGIKDRDKMNAFIRGVNSATS